MLDVRLAPAATSTAEPVFDGSGDPRVLRDQAGNLARTLTAKRVALNEPGLSGPQLAAVVEGLVLGAYCFSLAPNPDGLKRIDLVAVSDTDGLERGLRQARATVLARDLANTPANVKTPAWLAGVAQRELTGVGVEVAVRDEVWLAEHGFGGVLAVGAGSASPPRLVEATWRPRGARAGTHLVIVGKGITFDTGGINLKPGDSMRLMHTDMSGGAAAFGALHAVAAGRVPVRVTVLVPIAENCFSGSAMRPGDVIRHVGGRTSEITNTDAEGRLVLADALAYAAARLRPTALVDVATLTGAMKVALGLRTGGLFATTDDLADALLAAGDAVGEPLWRLPMPSDYESTLASDIADCQNSPGNPGGVTAALWLRPFAGDVPWAHLDIAGPARSPEPDGVVAKGATGFGARLLANWVQSHA